MVSATGTLLKSFVAAAAIVPVIKGVRSCPFLSFLCFYTN